MRQYEAKYAVFLTKPSRGSSTKFAKGGGWVPNGHGVLAQKITLSEDGNAFESTIRFDLFDPTGEARRRRRRSNGPWGTDSGSECGTFAR